MLVQGEFDAGQAGLETYKWKVENTGPNLLTGQDLLLAVFGNPVLVSGNSYRSGNTTHGVLTSLFSGLGYSPQQFFINGFAGQLASNDDPYPYWNYTVAGGSGDNSGVFADSAWTFAENDGAASRNLVNGSFDAWTYGEYQSAPIVGVGNLPIVMNFSGNEQLVSSSGGVSVFSIGTAPEPGRAILLIFGMGMVLMRRRRHTLANA
jgi:hypothetical protein